MRALSDLAEPLAPSRCVGAGSDPCNPRQLSNSRQRGRAGSGACAGGGGRIRLHFLPPYCPNDNKIERVWQDYMSANVTRNHTCRSMTALMREVRYYLRKRNPKGLPRPGQLFIPGSCCVIPHGHLVQEFGRKLGCSPPSDCRDDQQASTDAVLPGRFYRGSPSLQPLPPSPCPSVVTLGRVNDRSWRCGCLGPGRHPNSPPE